MDDKLYKKALNLEYLTVGYNVLEAFFSNSLAPTQEA
jgi:hypothetical protein